VTRTPGSTTGTNAPSANSAPTSWSTSSLASTPHGHAHPVSLGRELSTEQRRLFQHLVNTGEFATTVAGHQRE
jgi:hypothetical protein